MVRGRGHRRFWGLGGWDHPPLESELCSVGIVWSLPLPVHRQTHSHRHTCTRIDVHTHVHMHRRHMDTLTQHNTHTNIHTLRHAYHTDVRAAHTHTHTWADKTPSTHMYIHTHREAHMRRHMCAHANPDAHTSHTHTHTHMCTNTCTGHDDAICTWVESSGRRKAEEWGLGKRDPVFLAVESPQHLGAGTREEQQRWRGGGFGRRADSSGCVGSREVSRESARPLGHTGVLARAQEDRFRLRGVRGCSRPGGPPGGGAQS